MIDRLKGVVAGVVCVLALVAGVARAADDSSVARLTHEVRQAVTAPPSRANDAVLIALRQLHDERLRPLFAEMASRDVAADRLHGIFGLADLSEDGKVNIVQIANLGSKELRARALGAAIGADYLTKDQMRQVLTWPELEPSVELLVMGKLMQEGEQPSVDRLREIRDACKPDETASKIFSEMLIADLTGDSEATEARKTIDAMPDDRREAMLGFALAQVYIDKLMALRGFVVGEHQWAKTRPGLRLQSLAALMLVDPELGVSEWRSLFDSEEDLSRKIRLALVLLSAAPHVDASAFDPLIGSDVELLDLMGKAGRSVTTGEGREQAFWDVMRQNHEASLAWAFDAIDEMPDDQRVALLTGLMDRAMKERTSAGAAPAVLYEIARTLESSKDGAMAPYLREAAARSDVPLCEAFLSAVMECKPHPIWAGVEEPAWPSRRCKVLAAIADARGGQALEGEKLDLLVSAGQGGEGLPAAFRVQAAWLALCQLQKEREALAEVLAPSEE